MGVKMKFKLKLKPFFTKEAKNLINVYKRLIRAGRGVAYDFAPKKKKDNGQPWLIDTGETVKQAFDFSADDNSFEVFAKNKSHSKSNITYQKIFELHNQKNYSGVFGDKLPADSKMFNRLEKEVEKQVDDWLDKNIPSQIICGPKK